MTVLNTCRTCIGKPEGKGSIVNLEGFEYSQHITTEDNSDGYWVGVSKVGGGTVGPKYTGYWDAVVYDADESEVWRTGDLVSDKILTHIPHRHGHVAYVAIDYYKDED